MIPVIAKSAITKTLSSPIIQKTLIIGGVVVIAYLFSKKIGRFLNKNIKNIQENIDYNKELDKSKESYPKTQYKNFADAIQKAFDPIGIAGGTDEDTIYNVMRKLKTNNDWLLLNKAYGIRKYEDFTYVPWGENYEFNMVEAINFEDENAEMRNKINAILKSKNLKYRM
jgi:hypothetical protein